MATSVEQILGWHERGIIAAGQCVDELCKLAVDTDPKLIAGVIPAQLLGRIQERSVNIPRAEDLINIEVGTFSRDLDLEFYGRDARLQNLRYVNGLRTWKVYFESVEHVEYENLVRRNIEIGLTQTENGEGIPHEEVKLSLAKWFAPKSDGANAN